MALFQIAKEDDAKVEMSEAEEFAVPYLRSLESKPNAVENLLLCITNETLWKRGELLMLCFPELFQINSSTMLSLFAAADRLHFKNHVSWILGSELWRRGLQDEISDDNARELCKRTNLLRLISKTLLKPLIESQGLNYEAMCNFLRENGAILAGGFILGALTTVDPQSDIDIFIAKQNRVLNLEERQNPHSTDIRRYWPDDPSLYEYIRTSEYDIAKLQEMLPMLTPDPNSVKIQISKAIQDLSVPGIRAAENVNLQQGIQLVQQRQAALEALVPLYNFAHGFRLEAEFKTPSKKTLQLITVGDAYMARKPEHGDAIQHIKDNFDFSFCKCYFNGDIIEVLDPFAVFRKTDLAAKYKDSRSMTRVQKYQKRGFTLVLHAV
jgi:hypothetical protein